MTSTLLDSTFYYASFDQFVARRNYQFVHTFDALTFDLPWKKISLHTWSTKKYLIRACSLNMARDSTCCQFWKLWSNHKLRV